MIGKGCLRLCRNETGDKRRRGPKNGTDLFSIRTPAYWFRGQCSGGTRHAKEGNDPCTRRRSSRHSARISARPEKLLFLRTHQHRLARVYIVRGVRDLRESDLSAQRLLGFLQAPSVQKGRECELVNLSDLVVFLLQFCIAVVALQVPANLIQDFGQLIPLLRFAKTQLSARF